MSGSPTYFMIKPTVEETRFIGKAAIYFEPKPVKEENKKPAGFTGNIIPGKHIRNRFAGCRLTDLYI